MKLDFIPIDKLFVDATNMRHGRKQPDVSDILPSVRKRGVLVSLLVRPANDDGNFGISAGRRRFRAASIVASERQAEAGAEAEPYLVPCGILDEGDDVDALEASMLENLARLDPDEVSQWESFVRLVREGRTPEDIGLTFSLPDLSVRRILALGNLLPRIRDLYRREAIDAASVRHLTLASKRQQQAWLALHDDPDAHCPVGSRLKTWLFGGRSIKVEMALFDVASSALDTVTDLFGEDVFFADTDAFWTAQDAAIAERRDLYLAAGWSDVIILPRDTYFASWDYEKRPKRKGGLVYAVVRETGEVVFHEGLINRRAARAAERGEASETAKPVRAEVTSTQQTYIDLHRHAAVRAMLADAPGVALRLMVAHAIAGAPHWQVQVEPQATRNDAVRESVETCLGETAFDGHRRAALDLLGMDAERAHLTRNRDDPQELVSLFLRLIHLPDPDVLAILAVVMGETLASGSPAVEAVGQLLGTRMEDHWQADAIFFELIRDKEVLHFMVAETAGEAVASANAKEKAKTLKQIVRDCLAGDGGRPKAEHWVPRWMRFPPSAYTPRGGVGSVAAAAIVTAALPAPWEEQPVAALPAPDAATPQPEVEVPLAA
jgi:ParB family chromosome partitioning protein